MMTDSKAAASLLRCARKYSRIRSRLVAGAFCLLLVGVLFFAFPRTRYAYARAHYLVTLDEIENKAVCVLARDIPLAQRPEYQLECLYSQDIAPWPRWPLSWLPRLLLERTERLQLTNDAVRRHGLDAEAIDLVLQSIKMDILRRKMSGFVPLVDGYQTGPAWRGVARWALFLLGIVVLALCGRDAWSWFRLQRAMRRWQKGACPLCGYAEIDKMKTCAECGLDRGSWQSAIEEHRLS